MEEDKKMTELEKKLLSEKIADIFKERGYSENDKIADNFGKERNLENEITEYIDVFGGELIEDIDKIDSKINEFFYDYEILKTVNEKGIEISQEDVVRTAEETLKNIEDFEQKEINIVKDKIFKQISEKNLSEFEKTKFKDISNQMFEKISQILKFLKEQIKIQVSILKANIEKSSEKKDNIKNNTKDNTIEETEIQDVKTNYIFEITDDEKIKMSSIESLPKAILNYLSESDNSRVLRKLALNESLDNKTFEKLAKSDDLKVKEFLLENDAIPSETLEILIEDKDDYIRHRALCHRNLSSEILKELYDKNKENDEILRGIALNVNTPKYILSELSESSNENLIEIALKNKNHPSNNIFIKPELSKEQNDILYQDILMNSDFRKKELFEMFKNEEIYADKDGNAIFPVKENGKIVGAYQVDFKKNEKPILLENSYCDEESLNKAKELANKVFENLSQEESLSQEEVMEFEH